MLALSNNGSGYNPTDCDSNIIIGPIISNTETTILFTGFMTVRVWTSDWLIDGRKSWDFEISDRMHGWSRNESGQRIADISVNIDLRLNESWAIEVDWELDGRTDESRGIEDGAMLRWLIKVI